MEALLYNDFRSVPAHMVEKLEVEELSNPCLKDMRKEANYSLTLCHYSLSDGHQHQW